MKFNWRTVTPRALVPAIALCCALPSWSAREFTPQAGLWMIPSENNGQPGRGFSLDVQGNTAFLQVFNYEKSGDATFHTAVGQLDDSASMTVPLLRFKGGRSFGGPAQDAVEDGNAGQVTVKFTDGLNGTIQFPGESAQPIARFLIDQKLPFWWTQASSNPPSGKNGYVTLDWLTTGTEGTRDIWRVTMTSPSEGTFTLEVTPHRYLHTSDWDAATRLLNCTLESSTQTFDCLPGKPWEGEKPLAGALETKRLRFRMVGRDVVGTMQPSQAPAQRVVLNGTVKGSFSCKEPCMNPPDASARVYSMTSTYADGGDCITGSCYGWGHITQIPVSGAWVIASENTGRPGRGVFVDAQDNTLVMQTSDYLADGQPTFHLGASSLQSSSSLGGDTNASVSLVRYAGGRYFGGPAQSGREVANAGTLAIAFPTHDGDAVTDMATARITLPGEGPVTLRRLQFEPPTNGMEHMLGEYFVIWTSSSTVPQRGWVVLNRIEDGFAKNADGTVLCYRESFRTDLYAMTCALVDNPALGLGQNWKGRADIKINPFYRDSGLFMRTRDRHGNWLGLGTVALPSLAIP